MITLAYLTVQVRQGNSLARAQTRQSMVEQTRGELYKVVDDPSISSSFTKEGPLTQDEKAKLVFWLAAAMRQREYEWFQYQAGNIDRPIWEAYRGLIPIHLGTQRTLKWWQTIGSTGLDPSFVAFVNQLLDEPAPRNFFEELEALRI